MSFAAPIKRTCLIVDDSRVTRLLVRRIIEQFSFEIEEATDGKDALERCLQHMPKVIMLDWNMPVMNGIEFLHALRRAEGGDQPVVLFCTTEADLAHIREAIDAGANEYIMKPFDREIIEAKFSAAGLL